MQCFVLYNNVHADTPANTSTAMFIQCTLATDHIAITPQVDLTDNSDILRATHRICITLYHTIECVPDH
jgi:hypothetical protein